MKSELSQLIDESFEAYEDFRGKKRRPLREGKRENLIKRYVEEGPLTQEQFDFFERGDPSHRGKFLDWMLKMKAGGYERDQHILDTVRYFMSLVMRDRVTEPRERDINHYKSMDELEAKINQIEQYDYNQSKRTKSVSDYEMGRGLEEFLNKTVKVPGKEPGEFIDVPMVEVVEDSKDFLSFLVRDYEAAKFFGSNGWCIANQKYHWDSYYNNLNRMYFLFDKKRRQKYCVQVKRTGKDTKTGKPIVTRTVWTADDRSMSMEEFKKKMGMK